MIHLKESILNVKDTAKAGNDAAAAKIVADKFKKDVEGIFRKFGLEMAEPGKFYSSNPIVYVSDYKAASYATGGYEKYNHTVYTLSYSSENDYNKAGKFSYNENSFKLTLIIWYDEEAGRPRYTFKGFRMHLPATRTGGYELPWDATFPCKKVTPEFYNLALSSITEIIERFMKNTNNMQKIFDQSRKSGRNPQRTDFMKVATTCYKGILIGM